MTQAHHSLRVYSSIFLSLLFIAPCLGQSNKKRTTIDDEAVAKEDAVKTADIVLMAYPANPFAIELTESELKLKKNLALSIQPLGAIADQEPSLQNCLAPNEAYVIHLAKWKVNDDDSFTLDSSGWYVYHANLTPQKDSHGKESKDKDGNTIGECILKQTSFKANGQPLLYGDRSALLVGINRFDKPVYYKRISIKYKVSVTPATPENVQDLGLLFSAITGVTLPSGAKSKEALLQVANLFDTFVVVGKIKGVRHLPSDFNISISAAANSTAPPASVGGVTSLPDGQVGTRYAERIWTRGGAGVKTFKLKENTPLPTGWQLSDSGAITGMPDKEEKITFTVVVNDRANKDGKEFPLSLIIAPKPKQAPNTGGDPTAAQQGDTKGKSQQDKTGNGSQDTSGNSTQQSSTVQVVDCSSTTPSSGCNFSHTFRSDDKEYWDVSIGISIPGVREATYGADLTKPPSVKTHTDLYGMFDIYPFAFARNKESLAPHLLAGMPLTGQPFHRPLFGVAENLTRLIRIDKLGFPLPVYAFAGVVYMQQNILVTNPNTAAGQPANILKTDRALKGVYGIEVPISSIISKITQGAKNSSKSGGTGGKQGQGSNNQSSQ